MNGYYVGIREPVGVRKMLLETSKGVLQCLQLSEDVRDLRVEKAKIEALYVHQVRDIQNLVRKLRLSVPKVEKEKKAEVKVVHYKKEAVEAKKSARNLSAELDAIERELKKLG
jgi:hypothetical protein